VCGVDLDGSWYKSQDEEDRDLLKWFKDICGGTYLEIGGLDGITISNSYLYNKGLNWTGILVEASPVNYAKLIKNRQNEIATVHAGVCEKEADLHWVEADGAVGGFLEFAAPSFQQQWWSEEKIRNAKVVQCKTLERILLDTVGERFYFDFFTLDVEGAEYAILQSINFDLVGFGAIVVEADEHNQMKNMAIRTMLESNGYTYLETKRRSSWFVHNDFGIIYKELIYAL
jgi:FkbM family methyltransferase